MNILKIKENQKYLAIINNMYNKPELINFIKDKTINDIHQMGEFIDDSEDYHIDINDIASLEECKTFMEDLNIIDSEKAFLNNFIDISNLDKYQKIALKFDETQSKYSDFNELYNNYLNPKELNKKHIKSIYEKSTFNIEQADYFYNCEVIYEINDKEYSKDFDSILDYRDVALLRKKDQNEEFYF